MVSQVKTWLKVGQHLLRAAMVATALPVLAAGGANSQPIDLNTADAATLADALQGVGPAKAQAIVDYRRRHGPFKSIDELALVKGIGARTLERNRGRLIVRATPSAASAQPSHRSPTATRGAKPQLKPQLKPQPKLQPKSSPKSQLKSQRTMSERVTSAKVPAD